MVPLLDICWAVTSQSTATRMMMSTGMRSPTWMEMEERKVSQTMGKYQMMKETYLLKMAQERKNRGVTL